MPLLNYFIAYPAFPFVIGSTIEESVKKLTKFFEKRAVRTWKELDIAGHFIAQEVVGGISASDILVADISVLNFNVTYEVGFAIGQSKRVVLIKQAQIDEGEKEIKQLGIFDTVGWLSYENSDDLSQIIRRCEDKRAIPFEKNQINKEAPVYLLDAKYKSDQAVRVKSRVKKGIVYFRTFDPQEFSRMSAHDAISEVAQSIGVLVTLIPENERDARLHNLRASFLAGLAQGMDKICLIIQHGDDPVPIDYRDLVTVCKHPLQIDEAVAKFAEDVSAANSAGQEIKPVGKSFLQSMTLGAPAAEDEFLKLGGYFLQTDAFHNALSGDVGLILGRKGSGKTALFGQIRDHLREDKSRIIIDLKPEGYQLLKFKEDVLGLLQEGALEHTITALWEYILLLEITYKLLEKDKKRHQYDHSLYDRYVRLSDAYNVSDYSGEGDFSERLSLILQGVKSNLVSSSDKSDKIRLSNAQITEILYQHDIRLLRKEIQSYLGLKSEVWILIDNQLS